MKLDFEEPICALITPAGTAAINVVRISGKGSVEIVAGHFQPADKLLKARGFSIIHGYFRDLEGQILDQVLCSKFLAPHSYTGDDTVEISCHGNPRIAARILEVLLASARHARAGEFTLRALHNNKIDLIQAEAIHDLILSPGSKSNSAALSQLRGILSSKMNELLQRITGLRIQCELAIDFADQDLPQIDVESLRKELSLIMDEIRTLHHEGAQGRYIRDGIRICLAGAPNSGKSSLFNALLKENRAIVSPHPGTTRDYLEETLSIEGYTIVLYDTAGLRESGNEIEQEGILRSQHLMQEADLILYLIEAPAFDSINAAEEAVFSTLNQAKTLIVLSKSDLANHTLLEETAQRFLPFSCVQASVVMPDGLKPLTKAILQRFIHTEPRFERPLVTNTRHLAALERCGQSLNKAEVALTGGIGFEFAAFDLIEASAALEEILGFISPDDLLNRIFSDFCIGK